MRRLLGAALVLLTLGQGLPAAAWPRPSGHVNDFAGVLTEDDRAYLEQFLRTLERDTTAEVVVATLASLDGLSIEEYASGLFADWGIGHQQRDNGVLLLVAPGERKVRIEVGYGLEGRLPDGLAGEIIRTAILPEFRQGNLRRGIGRGVDRISRVVRGEAPDAAGPAPDVSGGSRPIFESALLVVLVLAAGFVTGLGFGRQVPGLMVTGGLAAAVSLVIALLTWPLLAALLVPFELAGMALGYRMRGSDAWGRRTAGAGDSWADSSTGPAFATGTSGDDSSSPSADFGGGSSGGGGASGDW